MSGHGVSRKSLLELDDLTVATLSLAAAGTETRVEAVEGPVPVGDKPPSADVSKTQ